MGGCRLCVCVCVCMRGVSLKVAGLRSGKYCVKWCVAEISGGGDRQLGNPDSN